MELSCFFHLYCTNLGFRNFTIGIKGIIGKQVHVASRRGSITLPVLVTDGISPGVTFIPFHYKEAAANLLTNDALDPDCKLPEAKVCAVKVEKAT